MTHKTIIYNKAYWSKEDSKSSIRVCDFWWSATNAHFSFSNNPAALSLLKYNIGAQLIFYIMIIYHDNFNFQIAV